MTANPPSAPRARFSQTAHGHVAMLAFSALVAGSFSLGAQAAPYMNPVALNAVRFAIATGAIGALVLMRGSLRREHFQAPWRYAVWGALMALYFGMMFWGLKTAPPVSMAAVFTLTPVMSAVFGWVLLRQVTTPRIAAALAIAAAGAVWVIFDASWASIAAFDIGRGEAIFFVGCIGHAAYAPMVPRLVRGEPGLVQTLGMLVAATLLLTALGTPALLATDWTALPAIVWITIFYVALAASAVTFFLIQYAARRLPGAKVMAYTYLVPAWVILWEGAQGNGWPERAVLAGVAMVVLGLFLLLKDDGQPVDRRLS